VLTVEYVQPLSINRGSYRAHLETRFGLSPLATMSTSLSSDTAVRFQNARDLLLL